MGAAFHRTTVRSSHTRYQQVPKRQACRCLPGRRRACTPCPSTAPKLEEDAKRAVARPSPSARPRAPTAPPRAATYVPTTRLAPSSTARPRGASRARKRSPRAHTSTTCRAFSSRRRWLRAMSPGAAAREETPDPAAGRTAEAALGGRHARGAGPEGGAGCARGRCPSEPRGNARLPSPSQGTVPTESGVIRGKRYSGIPSFVAASRSE